MRMILPAGKIAQIQSKSPEETTSSNQLLADLLPARYLASPDKVGLDTGASLSCEGA